MGREVRRVPANWKHPKKANGQYIPLLDYGKPYSQVAREWDEEKAQWKKGYRLDWSKDGRVFKPRTSDETGTYTKWNGPRPVPEDFMPEWPESEKTHYQMYETCSEGTPISPVMASPEELARWLADYNASAFGSMTANYQDWLCTIKQGSAPSMILSNGTLKSGVEACNHKEREV